MPNGGETAGNYVEWTKETGRGITLNGQRKCGGDLHRMDKENAAGNYVEWAKDMQQEITLKGQRKLGGELQGAASQLLTKRFVCVIIYRGILRKYLSVSILEGNL